MKYLFLVFMCVTLASCKTSTTEPEIVFADNLVIAHRGAWKAMVYLKIQSQHLKEAIRLKCAGSEFDVRMTSDNVLIFAHDVDYAGLHMESSTYET